MYDVEVQHIIFIFLHVTSDLNQDLLNIHFVVFLPLAATS